MALIHFSILPPLSGEYFVEYNGVDIVKNPEVITVDYFKSRETYVLSSLTKEAADRTRTGLRFGEWKVKYKSNWRLFRDLFKSKPKHK